MPNCIVLYSQLAAGDVIVRHLKLVTTMSTSWNIGMPIMLSDHPAYGREGGGVIGLSSIQVEPT